MRTAKHETFGMTPYFLVFGRTMCPSGDDYSRKPVVDVEETDYEQPKPKCEQFKALFESVRKELEVADNTAGKVYNLRRRCVEYKPGESVWRRNFGLSDASKHFSIKLAPKYVGPF